MKKHFGILMTVVCAMAFGLEMPSIFTDHMVLQRATEIRVWGKAPSSEFSRTDVSCNGFSR